MAGEIKIPIYEYFCDKCEWHWEEFQNYNDTPLKYCPACDAEQCRRIFSIGMISIRGATTLGALAEKNNKRLGGKREELINQIKKREPEFHGTLPSTASVMPKSEKTPWWRQPGEAVDQNLAKMTPEQTEKYVLTGKKPIPTK